MVPFSIIIPAYNLEGFILDTLASIEAQTFSDFEVIIVDDGSTDGTAEVCRVWCESHSRFSLFRKENGGVSSARNLGLTKTNGEYVIFVDGDDLISCDLLQVLYSFLEKKEYDIVNFNYRKVPLTHTIISNQGNDCLDGIEYEFDLKTNINGFLSSGARGPFYSSCFSVYKYQIIKKHKILFPESVRSGEDSTFSHIYALFVHKGIFLNKYVGYYYRTNPQSCIQSHQSNFFFFLNQELHAREYIHDYLENEKLEPQGNLLLQQLCWETMVHLAEYYPRIKSIKLKSILDNMIWHKVILPSVIHYSPIRYRRSFAKLSRSRIGMRFFIFMFRFCCKIQGKF